MTSAPVIVSLPIADRATSYRFYRDGLGLDAVGELADDGIPEPLQFVVNDGLRLMLVPAGGFGWVIGRHEVAPKGQSECLLNLGVASSTDADRVVDRARAVGAEIITEPADQPWGYAGVFADPDGHLWMVSADPKS
ncbi:VOC family protein [Micromonospora sp. NPDC048986]|uniref:VOC family protein n=1 Tax=Micromonospora sp. NPDC048986 TaxID=3155644 RepID=UPI0034079695